MTKEKNRTNRTMKIKLIREVWWGRFRQNERREVAQREEADEILIIGWLIWRKWQGKYRLNVLISRVGLIDEEDIVLIGYSEEGSGHVTDVSDEVESNQADPPGWIL